MNPRGWGKSASRKSACALLFYYFTRSVKFGSLMFDFVHPSTNITPCDTDVIAHYPLCKLSVQFMGYVRIAAAMCVHRCKTWGLQPQLLTLRIQVVDFVLLAHLKWRHAPLLDRKSLKRNAVPTQHAIKHCRRHQLP